MLNNRGYTILLDALFALVLVLVVSSAVLSINFSKTARTESMEFEKLHYVSEDALDVLNKVGVLDEVASMWAENATPGSEEMRNASVISVGYLEKILPPKVGYRLTIEGDEVANSSWNPVRRPEADATTKTHSTRLLVGYARGMPTRGLVARASLVNIREKTTSSFVYFSGFVGQGNVSVVMFLPDYDEVQEAYIEVNAGDSFSLYVNNNFCKSFSVASAGMSANVQEDISSCKSLLSPGVNSFSIRFTGSNISKQYIGGGFIEVRYSTDELDTDQETGTLRVYLPQIDGIINYYGSFYVPGWVTGMSSSVAFRSNYTTFMYVGDKLVFLVNGSGSVQTIQNTSTQLLNLLGSSALSEKTVPLRIGTGNISYSLVRKIGAADVVLITDISGSMRWRIGYHDTIPGTQRNCDDPQLYDNDTRRISLAKCLDKMFVNILLNTSGNRVGLVSFTDEVESYHELSNDNISLIGEVDSYPDSPSGGTCICCAINKAIELLRENVSAIEAGDSWLRLTYSNCGNSCDPTTLSSCTPVGWYDPDFKDSSWSTVSLPTVASVSKSVYYYRKHFSLLFKPKADATLYLRNSKGVECYLNGNYIGADKSCSTGNYWDNIWSVPAAYFNEAAEDNVLACRVRCSSSSPGIEFDAELTVPSPNKKYIIMMTDGVASYSCGGCSYSTPCSCGGSCTQTSGTYDCDGNPSDCYGTQCDTAIEDAICAASRAYSTLNATIYSIGFGPIAEGCPNANRTLQSIAECSNGSYYSSMNASKLAEIYSGIAEGIINSTSSSQAIILSNSMPSGSLGVLYGYPLSYLDFVYSVPGTQNYGTISVTQKSDRFNDPINCIGQVYIPPSVNVSDLWVTSYSAQHWTDYLRVNNSKVDVEPYVLWQEYIGVPYMSLGDPYIVNVPDTEAVVAAGETNYFKIETGDSQTQRTGCSGDDRAIYTLRLSSIAGYGDVFSKSEGCIWNIEFEDGSILSNENIPSTYAGSSVCNYTNASVVVSDDAISDAVFRLLSGLDTDQDHRVDVLFDADTIEFKTAGSGGVQSLWGPVAIKLIVWM